MKTAIRNLTEGKNLSSEEAVKKIDELVVRSNA